MNLFSLCGLSVCVCVCVCVCVPGSPTIFFFQLGRVGGHYETLTACTFKCHCCKYLQVYNIFTWTCTILNVMDFHLCVCVLFPPPPSSSPSSLPSHTIFSSSFVSILSLSTYFSLNVYRSVGYFIEPTILKTTNPKNKLMEEVHTIWCHMLVTCRSCDHKCLSCDSQMPVI